MKTLQNRLNNILSQLDHLKDVKVINIIAFGGPAFVGMMNYKLKEPITIKEAYSINQVRYPSIRGYTVFLEDGRYIMVRVDIDDNPTVYRNCFQTKLLKTSPSFKYTINGKNSQVVKITRIKIHLI